MNAIWLVRKKINMTKKQLRYREKNREERIEYYITLRELIKKHGSDSLVSIDEQGFERSAECSYAWSNRGKKVYD
jgi:putative transposase